jgi:small conductance mechanosensitive channel
MKLILSWLKAAGKYAYKNLLPAVITIVMGILIVRILLRIITNALEKSKLEKAAKSLIRSVIRIVLYGLLFLIVASRMGIDVTGIVALASVLTLAISLSVQNTLTNLMGGFTLLNTKPFVSGDYVEIAGQSGSVQEVGLTYTKLRTVDNKIISIPNSAVTNAEIINYTVSGTRRVSVEIAVSYDAPTQLVLEALREAGNVDTILQDKPPFAAMSSYGESAINYVLHVWSKTEDYWTTLFAVNEKVREVFAAKGINMTYPHLNVHLDK